MMDRKFFAEKGKQGGEARAKKLSPKRRKEIALRASKAAAKKRSEKAAARKKAQG
jgi:hypothetical protein